MITIKDNNICSPINTKHDINKLLFRDINYSSRTLEDGFISRDVNFYENNKPTFSKIINDCKEREIYEVDRFKDVILDKKEKGEEQEDSIQQLIKNMENKIKSIDDKIINTYKNSTLLEYSLPEDYRERKQIDAEDKELLDNLNQTLELFSTNKYTKDNL